MSRHEPNVRLLPGDVNSVTSSASVGGTNVSVAMRVAPGSAASVGRGTWPRCGNWPPGRSHSPSKRKRLALGPKGTAAFACRSCRSWGTRNTAGRQPKIFYVEMARTRNPSDRTAPIRAPGSLVDEPSGRSGADRAKSRTFGFHKAVRTTPQALLGLAVARARENSRLLSTVSFSFPSRAEFLPDNDPDRLPALWNPTLASTSRRCVQPFSS
jgi:hypothetical protein